MFIRKTLLVICLFCCLILPLKGNSEENITIQSLVFISDKDAVVEDEMEVEIVDLFVPDEPVFIAKMRSYIGQTVSMDTFEVIKEHVLNYYRKHGYNLVSVNLFADQDISDGEIKFLILLSKIDSIKVSRAKYFHDKKLEKYLSIKKGEILNNFNIITDLWWLNNNPFRSASLFLKEGSEFGTTDLTFKIKDQKPFKIYAEYQNTGNLIAGDSRIITRLNVGNLFNLDHQFNYQFITAPTIKRWWAQTANYIMPLPWGNIFKAIGFYSDTSPAAADLNGQKGNGKAWQLSGRYEIPIIRSNIQHIADFGYDFKKMNNALTFT